MKEDELLKRINRQIAILDNTGLDSCLKYINKQQTILKIAELQEQLISQIINSTTSSDIIKSVEKFNSNINDFISELNVMCNTNRLDKKTINCLTKTKKKLDINKCLGYKLV